MRALKTAAAAALLCLACGDEPDSETGGPDSGLSTDAGYAVDATPQAADAATGGTLEVRIQFGPSALDCAEAGVSQVDISVDGEPVLEDQTCDALRTYSIPAIAFGSRQVGVVSWSPNLWEGSEVVAHNVETGEVEVQLTQVDNPL